MASGVERKKKVRQVFGRLRVEAGGGKFKVELHKDGLWVRQFKGRKTYKVPMKRLLLFVLTEIMPWPNNAQTTNGSHDPIKP
jgi:hypothetical protein